MRRVRTGLVAAHDLPHSPQLIDARRHLVREDVQRVAQLSYGHVGLLLKGGDDRRVAGDAALFGCYSACKFGSDAISMMKYCA